jgi:hypothetical protein
MVSLLASRLSDGLAELILALDNAVKGEAICWLSNLDIVVCVFLSQWSSVVQIL